MSKQRSLIGNIKLKRHIAKNEGGKCSFCTMDNQIILHRYTHWTLIRNKFPWKNWTEHNLIVLNRHLDNIDIDKLTKGETKEYIEIRKKHPDFVFAHTAWTSQKVKHMHYHLLK